jgi:Fur family transcriptional regulator, ferric uptake regulator
MDPALRDRWLDEAQRRMSGAGMHAGAARTAVVELLAREGQCLLTAAEVTNRLRARGTGSSASVYRSLDELFGLGLLHRVIGSDGVARFEIADLDDHHHHFVDEETGVIEPFADDALEQAIDAVAWRLGAQLTGHDVILRGRRGTGA